MKLKILILFSLSVSMSSNAQLLSVYQADMMGRVLNSETVQHFLHLNTTISKIISLESISDENGRPLVSVYNLKFLENDMNCDMDINIYRLGMGEDKVVLGNKNCF